jgi:hypothetical protein
MGARTQVLAGAGVVGLALLMTGCSSGGSASPATTAAVTPTTVSKSADTAAATVTNLAPACPGPGTPASSVAIEGGGTHTSYMLATTDHASLVTHCNAALGVAGWTVTSTGDSGYGQYGGGGSTVTRGATYATFDVGSSGARTYLDVCVWPAKPATTECGQNSDNDNDDGNQDNNGNNQNDNQN